MRESAIEAHARREIESMGGELVKVACLGRIGFPDRIAMLPGARLAFIELKAPGKKPRPSQERWLDRLTRFGFEAFWTDNANEVVEWARQHAKK